jgi:hypothetical protein
MAAKWLITAICVAEMSVECQRFLFLYIFPTQNALFGKLAEEVREKKNQKKLCQNSPREWEMCQKCCKVNVLIGK